MNTLIEIKKIIFQGKTLYYGVEDMCRWVNAHVEANLGTKFTIVSEQVID